MCTLGEGGQHDEREAKVLFTKACRTDPARAASTRASIPRIPLLRSTTDVYCSVTCLISTADA